MTLKDTVSAMTAPDYESRLWAEYKQLEIRTEALQRYIERTKTGVVLEIEQLDAMRRYLHTLKLRCEREGVEV